MEIDKEIQIDVKGLWKRFLHSGWLPRLTFIGIVLMKVVGLLTWDWWLVLAPLWMISVMASIVLAGTVLVGITYPAWKPIYKSGSRLLREYKKDKKTGKKLAKQQSLTTAQSVLYFVRRTLRFIFVG